MDLTIIASYFKDKRVLAILGLVFVLIVAIGWYLATNHPTPTWLGIKPGQTTTAELEATLGKPIGKVNDGPFIKYGYKTGTSPDLDEYWLKNGKVVLIKQQHSTENYQVLDQYKKLGTAKIFFSKDFAQAQELAVYPDWGYAFVFNKNTKGIDQTWYFQPTTLDDFKITFGSNLLANPPQESN